jgi:thiol:disulfide interchange protein
MTKTIKRLLPLAVLGGALLFIQATQPKAPDKSDSGIAFFKGTWAEALAESAKTGKPIFADIYAVWCGPCKMMSNYVFTNDEVGAFYNENFVCVKVDAERGEGISIARRYAVEGYPTLLYVDKEGKVLLKTAGGRSTKDFITLGDKVLKSM